MKKRTKKANPPAEVIVNNNTTLNDVNDCNEQCNNSIPQVSDAGENEYSDKQSDSINDSNSDQKNDIVWPDEDLNELITRMEKCIPENDALAYSKRAEKLNWDQVAFSRYSSDQCRQQWGILQKQVRRFRILSEILVDAKEWLKFPHTKRINHRNPDMPRKPRSSYMIFYLKKKSKILREHPGIGAADITKIAALMYKSLTSEKKSKYDNLAAQERQEYLTKVQEYYEQHPELKPQASSKIKLPRNNKASNVSKNVGSVKSMKGVDVKPLKPKIPFQYYLADELEKLGNAKDVDKNAFKEDCKEKWKNMSDKKKVFWINWTEKCEAEYEEQLKAYIQNHPTFVPQPHKSLLNKEETLLKERLAGKPTKPPNSAYSLFSKRFLSSEEIKSIDPKERMNFVSIKWKSLPDDEKVKYQEEVTKSIREYKVAFDSYIQSLPEDKRQEELEKAAPKRKLRPSDEKNGQNQNPKRRRTERTKASKMKFKEPEQPPISAYKYFSNIHKGTNPSTAWKALSSSERKKYEDELMEKKREYIENFEKFLKSLTKEQLEEYSKAKKQIAKDDEDVDDEEEDDEDDSSNSSSNSEASEEENDESDSD